jgi:glutathione S-transferase
MIKIYGDPISGNCLKVKWTCERLAIPFTWEDVSVVKAETRTPQFLAINPAGQVPTVILEDGRALAESNAIIITLAEGSPLIPSDSYARAKMLEWLFWEQYSHEPYVARARFRMKELGRSRAELEPGLIEGSEKALRRLDEALTGRRFLVGDVLSLADISLVAYTRFAADAGFALADYPALDAWISRLEAELPIKDPR